MKKSKKRLQLHRETVAKLSEAGLGIVHGGLISEQLTCPRICETWLCSDLFCSIAGCDPEPDKK